MITYLEYARFCSILQVSMYEGRKKKVTKENEVIGQAATLEHRMSLG